MFGKQKHTIRVNVQDGPTIEGVFAGRTRHTYVLWSPRILDDANPPTQMTGHVEVPRERVLWFQVVD